MLRPTGWILGSAVLALAAACSPPAEQGYEPPRVVESTYEETGDFDAIQRHGQLRLLVVREPATVERLPRAGTPTSAQIEAAARFARSVGLEPVIVLVDHFDALIPALRAGRGDLIIANLPITAERRERIDFTVALDRTRQLLVKRRDDPLAEPAGLDGRSITVGFNSRYWDTARALQEHYPGLEVESLPALSTERQLDRLSEGSIDLTIVDGNALDAALQYRDGIEAAFPVSGETGVGWGVRAGAEQLKALLDRFITQRKLAQFDRERHTGDLPEIQNRRTVRVVTRNNAANYFVWRGQLLGFEYELARRFAEHLGVRLEVVVADENQELLPMLRDGRADFAAAFLSREGPVSPGDITYSRPYHFAVKQVVTDADDHALQAPADLSGRTFRVPADSEYSRVLARLREEQGLDFAIEPVPPGEAAAGTIEKVADGTYDLTLVDDHVAKNAAIWHDNVRAAIELGEPVAHRWAFRGGSEQLVAAANEFLAETYRSEFYNVVYAKYFRDHDRIRRYQTQRVGLSAGRQLSPYDDLIRKYAREHGFDWRLIAAQMFQESGFNPDARSWVGAVGLMQVMPRTAGQVGVASDLDDPETNIRAGTRYLAWLRERFEEDLSVRDRTWFTLAAFNAGTGHVRDARRLAGRLGLNPDRWFDNVEVAMRKLSERRYYRNARFGYVRGSEPVKYVRAIRERYQAYILWTNDCWPDCQPEPHPQVAEYVQPEAERGARALFSE